MGSQDGRHQASRVRSVGAPGSHLLKLMRVPSDPSLELLSKLTGSTSPNTQNVPLLSRLGSCGSVMSA